MEMDDSDITLGPGKLLGLFFMLVVVCGVFFAIGYSLGKTSAREQSINDKAALNASLATPAVGDATAAKPSAVVSAKSESAVDGSQEAPASKSSPDMTFYSAVKKDDHAPPPAHADGAQPGATPSATRDPQEQTADTRGSKTATPAAAIVAKPVPEIKPEMKPSSASGAFVVQIAAVSREEDAAALAGALRKKSYSVFVVNNPAIHDKLYHVQVGPFATQQDAEAMKARLTGEGYNPIVKRS